MEEAKKLHPDVIVADITMPHLNGIDALEILKKNDPRVKVVFLTMHQEVAYARRAIEAGASGFVLKHAAPEELVLAIRAALNGQKYITPALAGEVLESIQQNPKSSTDPVSSLTPRQREILQLLAEGKTAKDRRHSRRVDPYRGVPQVQHDAVRRHPHQRRLIHFAIKHGIVEI